MLRQRLVRANRWLGKALLMTRTEIRAAEKLLRHKTIYNNYYIEVRE